MTKLKKLSKSAIAILMAIVCTISLMNGLTFEVQASTLDSLTGYFYLNINVDGSQKSHIKINTKSNQKNTDHFSGWNLNNGPHTTFAIDSSSTNNNSFWITTTKTQNMASQPESHEGNLNIIMMPFSFRIPKHHAAVYKSATGTGNGRADFQYYNNHVQYGGQRNTFSDCHHYNDDTTLSNMNIALNVANTGMLKHSNKKYHATLYLDLWRCYGSLSVNPNGGTWNGYTNTQNYINACETTKQIPNPVRSGYTFNGWKVEQRDNSHGTLNGTTFTFCGNQPPTRNANGDVVAPSVSDAWWSSYTILTAQWIENPKITFHGNGQTDYDMDKQEVAYNETTNLVNNAFVKVGYEFKGWSTDPNASVKDIQYTDGASIKLTKNIDLYAIWQKNKTDLTNSNVLKNIEKSLEVEIVKVDEDDNTVEPLDATFDIFEWSQTLNDGKGGYKDTKSNTINSNETYIFNYSYENQGKWKVQEASVQAPYKNRHEEFEIDMLDNKNDLLNDIPFYENTMDEKDKGLFILNRGYEKGDIVRNQTALSGAKFYRAKRATTGQSLNKTIYWELLNETNYPGYKRLVDGADKWNTNQKYARTFSIEMKNTQIRPSGLQFALKKKDPSQQLLTGAIFNVYYTDVSNTICRPLNEDIRLKGNYYINRTTKGVIDKTLEIPMNDILTHSTNNTNGTKTLKLRVKEDKTPDGYKPIDPFDIEVIINKDTNGAWQVKPNSIVATFSDGKTQTIDNGEMFDAPELIDQPYKVDINLTKKGKNGYYKTEDLAGAVYDIFSDVECNNYVTSATINKKGKATVTGLDFKDYWIKESQAPTSGKFKLADGENSIKHLSTKDAKENNSPTADYLYEATVVDEEDTGMVIVNKADENATPLNTAKFALFKAPDDVNIDNVKHYDTSKLKMYGDKAETGVWQNIDNEVTWESKFDHSPFWESSEIFCDKIRVSYNDKAYGVSIYELDKDNNIVESKACGGGPFEDIEYERQNPDNKIIVRGFISSVFKPESCSISVLRNGEAVFKDIPFGKYILAETDLPTTGDWTKADNQLIEVTTDNGGNTRYSAVTTSILESKQQYCIRIHKKDKDTKAHLPGAVFKIYDEQKKGYLTQQFATIENPDNIEEQELLFTTDENGIALAGNLLGGTYKVYEVTPPDGYLINDPNPKTIKIEKGKQDGFIEEVIDGETVEIPYFDVEFEDTKTSTYFSKGDITTKKEIPGGIYHVEDMQGNEINKWKNDGTNHIVKGLVANESYYYVEDEAPAGYTIAPPIEFTMNANGIGVKINDENKAKVEMLDDFNKLEVYKKDIKTEKPVPNAHLELHIGGSENGEIYKDENGEAKWISTTKPKLFERIPNGTYTLVETQAPTKLGYIKAKSITFEVEESNDVQTITMYDDFTKTKFEKIASDTGEPQIGCRLQVLDKNKKLVPGADWITDGAPHQIDRLIPGEIYYLHEVSAPDDYQLAEDIPFIAGQQPVSDDTSTEDDYKLDGTDFTDAYGHTHPYDDNKVDVPDNPDDYVEPPKQEEPIYTIDLNDYKQEAISALTDAYKYADVKTNPDDTEEQIEAKTDMAVKTVDAAIKIATNDIKAAKDTNTVDAAIKKALDIINQYYTNVEIKDYANEGVVSEAEFDPNDVPESDDYDDSAANIVTVTMLNKPKLISILKKNETEQTVDNADLSLFDSNDKLLYSWKTGLDVVSVFKLGNGTYRLHEIYAPGNYDLTDDMIFNVDDNTTEVEYTMIDKLIRGSINVLKLDEKTKKPLPNVEFTLTGEDGTKLVALTDKNGEIHFGVDEKTGKNTLLPQKYTLVETKSVGTTILKDPIEIDLPLKLTEAEAKANGADTTKAKWDKDDEIFRFFDLSYEVSNDATLKLPQTGNNNLLYGIIAGAVMILLVGLFFGLRKRKQKLNK